ncbi:MAG: homocitrate synthase [Deltaproteobacteria bacterium]|jgi:homocitrate synthase NifV|nr:homocitrate synthase [Deltaproteobacteria bacterium]
MRTVRLVDTTLRDGGQSPGFAFSRSTKVALTRLLDEAGVFQIEAGVPAMGKEECADIRAIKKACSSARVSVWNRARRSDLEASFTCGADCIHICLPVSGRHIQEKLQITPEAALESFLDCVSLAQSEGYELSAGFEDSSRAEPDFLLQAARAYKQMGGLRLRLSDTVGVFTPAQAAELAGLLVAEGLEVEIHTHNDLGMAEANALSAALAGASYVDTTILGIGERAGNCHMRRFTRLAFGSKELSTAVSEQAAIFVEEKAAQLFFRSEQK